MSAGSNDSGEGQDFELNLAPIIDCFTVLITYMLVSASFISIDMLEVSVAASTPPSETTPPPPTDPTTSVSAMLMGDGRVLFEITGKDQPTHLEALSGDIIMRGEEIRKRWPTVKEINVKAEPGVQYKQIIKTVEDLKKPFVKVFLGE